MGRTLLRRGGGWGKGISRVKLLHKIPSIWGKKHTHKIKNKPASICSLAGDDGESRRVVGILARKGGRACLRGRRAFTIGLAREALM